MVHLDERQEAGERRGKRGGRIKDRRQETGVRSRSSILENIQRHLDNKLADINSSEDLVDNLDTLGVRNHGVILPWSVSVGDCEQVSKSQ